MDKKLLERLLTEGLSLSAIAGRVGRSPSTVSYWLGRHDLRANGAAQYGSREPITRDALELMVERGLTVPQMAMAVDRSPAVIRRALAREGLRSRRAEKRLAASAATAAGLDTVDLACERHGQTPHALEGRGIFRCGRCRTEQVSEHRRRVKRLLVMEAGGSCWNCGYARCVAALQFHHLEPQKKEFSLAVAGVTRSIDRVRAEAAKCVLLCATCHAEVEAGYAQVAECRAPAAQPELPGEDSNLQTLINSQVCCHYTTGECIAVGADSPDVAAV